MDIRRLLAASSLVALMAGAQIAPAQTPPAPPAGNATPAPQQPTSPASDAEDQAIVVTGTRLGRLGFTAPTPVTTVSADELRAAAPATLADGILQLPAFRASNGPAQSSSGSAGGGQAFLNLRSLEPSRTLVLLDGKRFVPSVIAGGVDVNLFPDALVERVDVVTGGASAAYGSDAVAGVVNFVLNRRFTGLAGSIQGGVTRYGDNKEVKGSLTYGTTFAGGRGHLIVSGEYFKSDPVSGDTDRPWTKAGWNRIPNGTTPNSFVIVPNTRISTATFAGLITGGSPSGTAAAYRGTAFDAAGNPIPFNFGTLTSSTSQVGGDGLDTSILASLAGGLNRKSGFGLVSYDVTDDINIYVQANYADVAATYGTGPNPATSQIRSDNAFLPASLRGTGVNTYTLGRYERMLGDLTVVNRSQTFRAVLGADATFGPWTINAYYEYGRSIQHIDDKNDLIIPNYTAAVDAVTDSSGKIVCRASTVAAVRADAGCVPWNPFGEHAPTAAQLAYLLGTSSARVRLREDVASLSAHGDPFSLWAGPVSLAAGIEYRRDAFVQTSDARSQAPNLVTGVPGVFRVANFKPSSGNYNVAEGFAEILVPLAKDQWWAKSLEFNGAVRVTSYSSSGKVVTWKAGMTYDIIPDIRLRGTISRDIRAPNLSELFVSGAQQKLAVVDRPSGISIPATAFTAYSMGNTSLRPEKADTRTVGIVLHPSSLRGLDISVDAYDINVKGAIAALSAQEEINRCAAGEQFFCTLQIRNSGGTLTGIYLVPINLASLKTRGIDFEASYRTDLSRALGTSSSLGIRVLANYVDRLSQTVPGSTPIDRAGDVASGVSQRNPGVPHWRWTGQLNFNLDRLNLFVQERFVGGGRYFVDPTTAATTVTHFSIAGQYYTDLRIGYKLGSARNVELFASVNNLFNNQPPPDPWQFSLPQQTNYTLYDTLGQRFHAGVNFKF